MRVVGIDPGTHNCGYAVIEFSGSRASIQGLGVWKLSTPRAKPSLGERLERLHSRVSELFVKWNPTLIGLEKAVVFKNVGSSLKLSEARGVIRLSAFQRLSEADARIVEISPTMVKKHTAGWGMAGKADMLRILEFRFQGLHEIASQEDFSYDAFDALGIAWSAHVLKSRAFLPRGAFESPAQEM